MLGKNFPIDINSLSKLSIYLFVPSFIFVNLYMADIKLDMLKIVLCGLLLLAANDLLGRLVGKLRGYDVSLTNAFKNSIMFNNSGNIGLSLIVLVFSSGPFVVDGKTPYLNEAITAQLMVLVLQNVSANTLGFFNASRADNNLRGSLGKILSMPPIYVIPAAFFIKYAAIDLTVMPIWPALNYLKDGLVPMSLTILGVQLANTEYNFRNTDVYLAVFIRLIVGPVLAIFCIVALGFSGVVAQTVLIAYSVPTAVNTVLIAVECKSRQNFAAQAVMMSTLCSSVTLTLAIYAANIIFPV